MSKLIQLRHRIKAIETIKKITHAMRLIAMSSHSQLKNSQSVIASYTHQFETIFKQLHLHAPSWHHRILNPETNKAKKIAIILVGSQKGLCGSFNTNLFKLATKELKKLEDYEVDLIPVGQKVLEFVSHISTGNIKHEYQKFSIRNISEIAHNITHSIFYTAEPYRSVLVISNTFKSFFAQYPKVTQIIPQFETSPAEALDEKDDLIWEQSPEEILNELAFPYISAQIQLTLFNSLLAEHAARFVSMDSATRNANGILDATKLEYNKLRQAKITKELTELSGSY